MPAHSKEDSKNIEELEEVIVESRPTERSSSFEHNRQESASLKRTREGSLEPTPEALVAPATTKKNRLGDAEEEEDSRPNSPLDALPEDPEDKPNEENNVGEVRKKVEKMTWKDGKKVESVGIEEWEEIDQAEASGTEENATDKAVEPDSTDKSPSPKEDTSLEVGASEEGKDLKRKLLARSESSLKADEPAKRQKDTPSPDPEKQHPEEESKPPSLPLPDKVEPVKAKSTFSSFATGSAFKTASSGARSGLGGFGSFSSTANPFAAKKSPPTAEQPEAGPSKKTFDDILSSTGDDDHDGAAKVHMTEQEIATGEEDERTVHSLRTKLYVMQSDGGWKERGVGLLKLNVGKTNKRARLVMRAEGVLRLILNVSLYVGMSCLEDGKHVRMTVFEDGERRLVTFRTGSNKVASELCDIIREYIPLESASASHSPDPEAAKHV